MSASLLPAVVKEFKMTLRKITLIDPRHSAGAEEIHVNEVYRGAEEPISIRITKRRLAGGLSDGVDILEVDNGKFSFTVLLSKGMGLWRGRCGGVDFKWDSPVCGPVHPKNVPVFHPSGLGWLEGFDEWVVRCGLTSNGAPEFDEKGNLKYSLHGRIANKPAREAEVTYDTETGEITVTGIVDEAALFSSRLAVKVTYTTKAGSSKLNVCDKVLNLGSAPAEFELLYHINTGFPFITPGAKIMVPFEKMTPRDANAKANLEKWDEYLPEVPDSPENCYLFEMAADKNADTRVLLICAAGDRGISLSFNKEEFPHFLIWKVMRPNGDTYVTGIEPCVNFPNTRSFEKEHERVVSLAPGASRVFHFEIEALHTGAAVSEAAAAIEKLQKGAAGEIVADPIPEWCE